MSGSEERVIEGVPIDVGKIHSPEVADRNLWPHGIPMLFYKCTWLGALVVSFTFMNTSMVATIQAKEIASVTSTSTQGNGCKNAVAQPVERVIQIFDARMVLEARGIGVEPAANMLDSCLC